MDWFLCISYGRLCPSQTCKKYIRSRLEVLDFRSFLLFELISTTTKIIKGIRTISGKGQESTERCDDLFGVLLVYAGHVQKSRRSRQQRLAQPTPNTTSLSHFAQNGRRTTSDEFASTAAGRVGRSDVARFYALHAQSLPRGNRYLQTISARKQVYFINKPFEKTSQINLSLLIFIFLGSIGL